jgi:hypothetical protein
MRTIGSVELKLFRTGYQMDAGQPKQSSPSIQQGPGIADPVRASRDCSNDPDDKDSGGPCTSSAPKRSPSHGVRSTSRTNDLRGDRAECRLNASRNRYGAVIQQAEYCFHSVNRPTALCLGRPPPESASPGPRYQYLSPASPRESQHNRPGSPPEEA